MALDLEQLIAPVSEDEPAGPDLAYDNDRMEIEQTFEIEVSIDASGVAAEIGEVDWRRVIDKIAAQSRQTKDIWLPVYLCRAGARSGSLETVEIGAQYLAALLEDFWPTLHPQLDEYGFQGRKGPCDSLTGIPQFLGPLRRITLLRHARLGDYSGADFERFRAGGEAEEGYGMFRAALEDVGEDGLREILGRVDTISEAIKRADTVLTANAEDGGGTNFRPTYVALTQIKRSVEAFLTSAPQAEPEAETEEGAAADGAPRSGGERLSGRIESRDDVVRALDALSDYYRRREPAHPAPILLQRAREWVSLDFMQILADIAPAGVDEART
ncbi:MAG: type secretion-associated protein ImpA family, partial [Phenylobacterium sp.]|nr:type secretion-associated protein ImpA family [Phenylobacterium sp.]